MILESKGYVVDYKGFTNKHVGRRGFVIGGGPSCKVLKDYDLADEIVVGANHANIIAPADYLVSVDSGFVRSFREDWLQIPCVKVTRKIFQTERKYIGDPNAIYTDGKETRDSFPIHIQHVSINGSSGLLALRVACLLGLNPIYLVGIDCTTVEKQSHFHTRYKFPLSELSTNSFTEPFTRFIKANENKVEIISCSSISLLNKVIPYEDIQSLGIQWKA